MPTGLRTRRTLACRTAGVEAAPRSALRASLWPRPHGPRSGPPRAPCPRGSRPCKFRSSIATQLLVHAPALAATQRLISLARAAAPAPVLVRPALFRRIVFPTTCGVPFASSAASTCVNAVGTHRHDDKGRWRRPFSRLYLSCGRTSWLKTDEGHRLSRAV